MCRTEALRRVYAQGVDGVEHAEHGVDSPVPAHKPEMGITVGGIPRKDTGGERRVLNPDINQEEASLSG